MAVSCLTLSEIGPEGLSLTVDDPAVWDIPLAEFRVACRVVRPLRAELFVVPQDNGCLLRGRITGEVALPCDRCAEETCVALDQAFDEFEAYPDPGAADAENCDERTLLENGNVLRLERGAPVLDVAAFLWEEFSLALPLKPLCSPQCRGVCPLCGKNLNEGPCGCRSGGSDPRLAALRNLKVS
ncbi:MAG: DUF177 domain-containing protein [Desulfovibrionaceae bacterium]|nr:DUF177 domain-containing protein [Desulfovibrionaceae bacterium]